MMTTMTTTAMAVKLLMLDLATTQGDITTAFLYAPLDEGEQIYVEITRGFRCEGKVYKLKQSHSGLRQSPINFFKYICEKMEACGIW